MPILGLHPIWAVVLLAIVLILFGVGRLPSVGAALGRSITEFKKALNADQPKSGSKTDAPKD